MKDSILPAVLILYIALWSVGMSGPVFSQKNVSRQSANKSNCPAKVVTGVFYIDNFLNLPHPEETIVDYGTMIIKSSLNLSKAIWTKAIKNPVMKEYEFIRNLGESLKIESLFLKTLNLTAKSCWRLLASS